MKVGDKVVTKNIQDEDDICCNGMIGEIVSINQNPKHGVTWIYEVEIKNHGFGWFSFDELEIVND